MQDGVIDLGHTELRVGIFGTGQTALQILSIFDELDIDARPHVIGLFDDDDGLHGSNFEGLPVLGGREEILRTSVDAVIVAVGQISAKKAVASWMDANNVPQTSAIHPSANVPPRSKIGEGSVVCAGVTLSTNPHLGRYSFLGPAATVSHDTFVGDLCLLSVGSTIGARVDIEDQVFVGAAASVMPTGWGGAARLRLGEGSTVGVGAVVISDVEPGDVVVGVPAKPISRKG